MKSYLSLVPLSAKVRKRQNRMTVLCIVIAVFLVTAVFNMADMAIRMEKDRRVQKDGNWHLAIRDIDPDTAAQIAGRRDVAVVAGYAGINGQLDKDYFLGGKRTAVCGVSSGIERVLPGFDGDVLPAGEQVLLTENARDVLGIQTGDTVSLTMPDGGTERFVVAGFNSETGDTSLYDAVVLFVDLPTLERIRSRNQEPEDIQYFVQFKARTNLGKAAEELKHQYALPEESVGENVYLMAMGGSTDNNYILGLYGIAAFLAVLVLLAGVFMIAGSLHSGVTQRTSFYGMLRCLGAGKNQIMQLVRLEALSWCKTAIPAGAALGVVVTWGLCAFLRLFVGGEFADFPLWQVSPAGIVSGVIVGLVTVWLAASAPARRAAQVSPVAAVSGNADAALSSRFAPARPTRRTPRILFGRADVSLGAFHAVSSRKNLLLMTGSFALGIILFLSFSVMLVWVNMVLNPLKPYAPDLSLAHKDASAAFSHSLVSELAEHPAVQRAFGRMYVHLPAVFQNQDSSIDLISYDETQFRWAKEDLVKGTLPTDCGEDALYVLTVFDKSNSLTVGDTIQLDGAKLVVSGVLDDSPFSSNEIPTVICPESTFTQLTGICDYAVIDMQLTAQATDAEVQELRVLAAPQMDDRVIFSDRRETNREVESTYWAFNLFVYAFLAVIALITVLNIVNSISLSVSARMKQYGVMRAVGMEGRQITAMIAAEALTYGIAGLLAGGLVGLPLHRLFYTKIITNYFGVAWQIPWVSLGISAFLVLTAVCAAVRAPAKRIREMPITATINEL